jgi:hypothetical protein
LKRTLEQLRSQVWPSREAAVKDLKKSGFGPRGSDYELREVIMGSWQIAELDTDPVADGPAMKKAAKAEPNAYMAQRYGKKGAKVPAAKKPQQDPPAPTPEPIDNVPSVDAGIFDPPAEEPAPSAGAWQGLPKTKAKPKGKD